MFSKLNVEVQYGDQLEILFFVVVGDSLFGQNWLKYLCLDWSKIASIHSVRIDSLNTLMRKHRTLFSNELGAVEPYKASLHLRPAATPRFFKPRSVLFAIRDAISKQLDRLDQKASLRGVMHSKWAAPTVPVPKKDGRYCICRDYKMTINQALEVDQYPLL